MRSKCTDRQGGAGRTGPAADAEDAEAVRRQRLARGAERVPVCMV